MEKVYFHKDFENKIYDRWEKAGVFTPQKQKNQKPFTIIMPPPNANDPLHIGHARFVAIEDILIRYHRALGAPTLWLPGADHAGIETQYVFEKRLAQEGKSRFDYDRDTFYQMVWDYCQENKKVMEGQLRQLGASCDWSRNKFTLDPDIIKVVNHTFKKLYDQGLVYRGERMVNYCPKCGTSFSELEVMHREQDDEIYYIDYGSLTIATTRPETIFADVAVAVSPKDKKYKDLIGQTATIPIINRQIPIIADSLVDASFGTGALKVTPAHDPTDFEIGQKHQLPSISVIDENGRMVATPPQYVGLKVLNAREAVVADLESQGKLKKTEPIHHTVGICYRCKNLIEPTISTQWFLKVAPLVEKTLAAIKEKKVAFLAKKFEKIAVHWLKNLKDWNISRQIVWGIRIPAFRCDRCLEWTITEGATPEKCQACGHSKVIQDPDTFDTWFSSGQWPYATLQTTQEDDFEYFYPTSVMETAYDILPFWVIRMIMLGLYSTGQVPFRQVVIHGLVRDRDGQKISKSKGNVIDPIEMVEKYGADALRLGLVWGGLVENDISLSEDKIRAMRNFGNKLWNIARYISFFEGERQTKINDQDREIKAKLKEVKQKYLKLMDKSRLNEAAELLYNFIWRDLADIYLEQTKNRREEAQETLEEVLKEATALLHPFLPFTTEAIWQSLFAKNDRDLLAKNAWSK